MLPKVMGPEHIRLLAEVVSTRERAIGLEQGHTQFIALVETAAAIPGLHAIAAAHERLIAIGIGNEDLATELHAQADEDTLYPFAMQLVAAARAAGIAPFGGARPVCQLRRSRRLPCRSTAFTAFRFCNKRLHSPKPSANHKY